MNYPLDPFTLPDGMLSSGDPVEENPFPENAPEHEVWADATRRAEEELCRFKSRLSKERPACPESYADFQISHYVGKFDIWAKRAIRIVWDDAHLRNYDRWLCVYAQTWLDLARKTSPILVDVESLCVELRLRLIERIEFWKAEGRSSVAPQKAHQNVAELQLESAAVPPDASDAGSVASEQPSRGKRAGTGRVSASVTSPIAAERMQAFIESKGIDQTEFATQVGTTDRTLRSFRKTGVVRRAIFEAIVNAMGTTKEALLKAE